MKEEGPIDLSIIIVNWNTKEFLRNCLESIYRETKGVIFEVIVIDNASVDASSRMVEKEFPEVILIKNKKNFGFARANNQGFTRAEGRYILIVNPDTEITENALFKMVKHLDLNKDAGAAGAKFLYPDGSFQRYYNRFPTLFSIMGRWFLPAKLAYRLKAVRSYLMLDDNFDRVLEVPQPAGACIMLRRDLFVREGFMDEKFPIFFGDVDLCRRIYKKGLKIVVLPDAKIIHYRGKGGLEQGKLPLTLSAEYFISMVDYFSKHEGGLEASLLRFFLSFGFLLRTVGLLMGAVLRAVSREELKYEVHRVGAFLKKKSSFNSVVAS